MFLDFGVFTQCIGMKEGDARNKFDPVVKRPRQRHCCCRGAMGEGHGMQVRIAEKIQ